MGAPQHRANIGATSAKMGTRWVHIAQHRAHTSQERTNIGQPDPFAACSTYGDLKPKTPPASSDRSEHYGFSWGPFHKFSWGERLQTSRLPIPSLA